MHDDDFRRIAILKRSLNFFFLAFCSVIDQNLLHRWVYIAVSGSKVLFRQFCEKLLHITFKDEDFFCGINVAKCLLGIGHNLESNRSVTAAILTAVFQVNLGLDVSLWFLPIVVPVENLQGRGTSFYELDALPVARQSASKH